MQKVSLREYRENQAKSKMQFAKELGIPYTTYLRYEEDLKKAPFAEVVRICEKLQIGIAQIDCCFFF